MTDEHFGIGVVEMMSAGLFTIAHNSAGPKYDIIGGSKTATGGLATSVQEYADQITQCMLAYDGTAYKQIRAAGKIKAKEKFGDQIFMDQFKTYLGEMIN